MKKALEKMPIISIIALLSFQGSVLAACTVTPKVAFTTDAIPKFTFQCPVKLSEYAVITDGNSLRLTSGWKKDELSASQTIAYYPSKLTLQNPGTYSVLIRAKDTTGKEIQGNDMASFTVLKF